MNLSNYYWYFKSALTPKFCDDVIKFALSSKETMGVIGDYTDAKQMNKEQIKDVKVKRNSDVVWLNENWIYKEIHPYIHTANKNAGWNFKWERSQIAQFTKYKLNQYYDWHCDSNAKPYSDPKSLDNGKILPKGSIIVFPSFVWHRVKPVTKGTRYSLVIWSTGDPYK